MEKDKKEDKVISLGIIYIQVSGKEGGGGSWQEREGREPGKGSSYKP